MNEYVNNTTQMSVFLHSSCVGIHEHTGETDAVDNGPSAEIRGSTLSTLASVEENFVNVHSNVTICVQCVHEWHL